jgi:thioredoxin 1
MATQKIQTVTDDSFAENVFSSTTPVLVDFWASWCPPCRALTPVVEQVAEHYQQRLKVVKLDVDENGQTALRFNVQSIPTLILFVRGAPVERIVGFMPREELLSRLDRHLIAVEQDSVGDKFVGG